MTATGTSSIKISSSSNVKDKKPLVKAKNLGVYYYSNEKRDDFKSHVHGYFKSKEADDQFWALKDISFKGYAGDIIGVIGSNGAGKTTLCRVIAGLLRPNRGKIRVRGEVSALLSLGTGFNNELTGNENILLNGLMLGLNRKQINELMPSIQEFSGLGSFLEQPLKRYSSGMRARLGFSIASSLDADILIIDEVLSTGDMEFNERAVKKMWEIVNKAKLVMVVTHSTDFIEENCNRAIWVEKGEVKSSGKPNKVIAEYKEFAADKEKPKRKRIVNLNHTNISETDAEAVKVDKLGIKFTLSGKPFWALKDISFTVKHKEIVGIIGPNGAGKSTLCRALSRIYKADVGNIKINGEVAALLGFGTGFNVQLSGYDNIYLNGMMLGIPKKNIQDLEEEIVEFAELEKFIDKPVKQYSKGMKSRLGFSIASNLQPNIFIVDEALSAGDIAFQEKAAIRMQEMLEDARAVFIVTHSMKVVKKLCTRALFIKGGELLFDGDPEEAITKYKASTGKGK